MRANEVRHARRHNDLVAEGQGFDGAVLVIRPLPVLRVTEFEGYLFLIEVEDKGDDDTTGRTGEGMLLHVLVANLGARDDLRIARDANNRVANRHTEIQLSQGAEPSGKMAPNGVPGDHFP